MKIIKDNAFNIGKNSRGWFIGHFMDKPELCTEDLEIQLINLEEGYLKESTKINPKIKAITILIDGEFELSFPAFNKTVRLKKRGDFVKFDLSSKHIGEAIKDTTILTIKWPSIV